MIHNIPMKGDVFARPPVIFIDVDDTLVRSVGAKRIPMPMVIAEIKAMHARGAALYLWSSGGSEYARSSAIELGIEDLFSAFLPKPDAYIDDQSVDEWRFCTHVLPGNAGSVLPPLRKDRLRPSLDSPVG